MWVSSVSKCIINQKITWWWSGELSPLVFLSQVKLRNVVKLFPPHWRLPQDRSLAAVDSWGWCRKDAARKVGGTLRPILTQEGTKMPCALGLTSTRGRPASLSQGSGCLPAELTAAEASLCHRVGVKQPCTCELCRQAGCYCITNSIEGGRYSAHGPWKSITFESMYNIWWIRWLLTLLENHFKRSATYTVNFHIFQNKKSVYS